MKLGLRLTIAEGLYRVEPEGDITPYESAMLCMFMVVVTNGPTDEATRSEFINDHNLQRHFKREYFN